MRTAEVLRRSVREFLDIDVVIRHLPDDSASLSADLTDRLDIDDSVHLLESCFQDLSEIPNYYAIAFMTRNCEDKLSSGVDVFSYHFVNPDDLYEDRIFHNQVMRQLSQLTGILKRGRRVCMEEGFYVHTEGSVHGRAARLVREIFTRDSMSFDFLGRQFELPCPERLPASWFEMAVVNH